MSKLDFFCMSATTFAPSKDFDEDTFRQFLSRQVDVGFGVYLASGGSGESHALTYDDLRRVYECGVATCKGKVPVHANLPEQHTPSATFEQAHIAIKAGIEVLNLYPLEGRHNMRPTDTEISTYFDMVLSEIKHPMVLAISPGVQGYMTKPGIVAEMCKKHRHIESVRLHNVPDTYLMTLKDMISRDISYYFQFSVGNFNPLAIGVDGLFAIEANIIPRTCREFVDSYERQDHESMMRAYGELRRFDQYCQKWTPGGARPLKMAMKVLNIPGGEGGLRLPYLMPPEEELKTFASGLRALKIREIEAMAKV